MVTIPTIDQISGTTVMNKMRSLIHAFINFATGVDDEITEFENTVTQDFYTKLEIDTKFADYYTKSQIDNGWYTKFEIQNEILVNYYTKTQIDTYFTSYYSKTETDTLLNAKQNVLTAGTNITIENDVISATGGGSGATPTYFDTKMSLVDYGVIDNNGIALKDFCIEVFYTPGTGAGYYKKRFDYKKGTNISVEGNNGMLYCEAINYGFSGPVFSRFYFYKYNNNNNGVTYYIMGQLATASSYYNLKINDTSSGTFTYNPTLTIIPTPSAPRYRVGVYE